jgi:hypothetical protein
MLNDLMVQEIIDLKLTGFSVKEIHEHLAARDGKAPSLPTIRKYYGMDTVPDNTHGALAKPKAFDDEPFRDAIIKIVERNPGCCISSVYDVLEERFVYGDERLLPDGTGRGPLPGNQQTLRNYVRHLRQSGVIGASDADRRIYDHVFDTPPAQQCIIDFGQQAVGHGLIVHFIALLMRYSRLLGVYAQGHCFDGAEACRSIHRFFAKMGGRPKGLVIDQDSVFVASEHIGEVIEAAVFKGFLSGQELRLWVCNKADPESKGGVENLVGFVKKNYFSARETACMKDVWRTLPGWCARKNARIHQATFLVPMTVFSDIERPALRPLVPSVYEGTPINLVQVKVGSMPYFQYRSSKYSVPREMCFSHVYYKAIGERLHVYDEKRRFVCTHAINPNKGSFNQLEEHRKEPASGWMLTAERLRAKYNCFDFQHLINGFKKESPRHLGPQLKAVEDFLGSEAPDRALVADVMRECCKDYRYRFSQSKAVFELCKAGRAAPAAIEFSDVQKAGLDACQEAFEQRCAG